MRSVHRDLIVAACTPVGWDPRLLEAQVWIESADDPFAFRYEHAYFLQYLHGHPEARGFRYGPDAACSRGLLQLLWETALEAGDPLLLDPWDLYDPATNLRVGLRLLTRLRTQTADIEGALAAFNGGLSGNVRPPYRNLEYAQRVLAREAQLDA